MSGFPKPEGEFVFSTRGGGGALANQVGKRYFCAKCGTEMIVTRAGSGELVCCGQPMQLKS